MVAPSAAIASESDEAKCSNKLAVSLETDSTAAILSRLALSESLFINPVNTVPEDVHAA